VTHTATVALATQEVLERAKRFFAERIPHVAAFVEREGPGFLVLRGQGGEEVVFSVRADGGGGGGGGGRSHAGAGIDPVLRPSGGPVLLDPAACLRRGGRMTAVEARIPVRVMVTDVWDQIPLAVAPTTTIAELKRQALTEALKRDGIPLRDYVVKFRGAQVLDEGTTLAALGAGPNSPFIVLPARRQPVR